MADAGGPFVDRHNQYVQLGNQVLLRITAVIMLKNKPREISIRERNGAADAGKPDNDDGYSNLQQADYTDFRDNDNKDGALPEFFYPFYKPLLNY